MINILPISGGRRWILRAAHARRRYDGVCGVRPGAGAYGAGGEDDEGVDEHGGFVFLNTDWHGLNGGGYGIDN